MLFENADAENVVVVNNISIASPQPQMRMSHRNLPPKSYTVEFNLGHGQGEASGRRVDIGAFELRAL